MNTFAQDVDEGLSASNKYLFSKYIYDDKGSRLFQDIMAMPEYYLTDAEREILSRQSSDIINATGFEGHFNIIELGAGDGAKTYHLLDHLLEEKRSFTYYPIDISTEALEILTNNLKAKLPLLDIQPQEGDYFKLISKINTGEFPSLFLFLGANIGNYTHDKAVDLLRQLHEPMKEGDRLLIGLDLKKNPFKVAKAYFDSAGITKAFNMNLLERINRELAGNFKMDQFDFYSFYHPISGAVKSFIISLDDQEVNIGALDKSFHFDKDEAIATELSQKYSLKDIEKLAKDSGFELIRHFLDEQKLFTDSLWGFAPFS